MQRGGLSRRRNSDRLGRSAPKVERRRKTARSVRLPLMGGCGAVAQQRKGYYRARHYVQPSSASASRWKKPSTGVILVAGLLAIAGWNTLFGSDSGDTGQSPQPRPSGASAPAGPGR